MVVVALWPCVAKASVVTLLCRMYVSETWLLIDFKSMRHLTMENVYKTQNLNVFQKDSARYIQGLLLLCSGNEILNT